LNYYNGCSKAMAAQATLMCKISQVWCVWMEMQGTI
jgi:hypothetical protein